MYSVKLSTLVRNSFVRFHASLGQGIDQYYIKHTNIYWLLITKLIDLSKQKYDNDGITPLTLAVEKNNIHMVRFLVAHGSVVYNYVEFPEVPLLAYAALYNRFDILKFLVNIKVADREMKKLLKNTAFCLAIYNGHYESAKFLIDNCASINRLLKNRLSPLESAIIGRNDYMVSYLLSHNVSVSDTIHHGFTLLMTSIIHENPSAALRHLVVLRSGPGCAGNWL
ncbi:unnamed protein product [Rodentolepis nana]|uniref:ANK_REP_REGION domain-containing protein n=1 Tax=Rodentolepis nana TaxID=102285 RepID=A0A0R3TGS8_RODNA|nr:unnamed protein product [Rodentolepis nana]